MRHAISFLGALAGSFSTGMSAMSPRVAVVTGANKGIGLAIARKIAETPDHLCILTARNPDLGNAACEELKASLPKSADRIKYKQLDITDATAIERFAGEMEEEYGRVDVLVNNAGLAFKGSDPTPFAEQAAPTFNVNYYGTVQLTERLLPLVKKSDDGRIVFVASSSGHLNIVPDDTIKRQLSAPDLTKEQLAGLGSKFVEDTQRCQTKENGWPMSCYGMSKVCIIAYSKILARQEPSLRINSICPGYVDTDMTSHRGHKTPEEGARTPFLLACQMDKGEAPTGQFWRDEREIQW